MANWRRGLITALLAILPTFAYAQVAGPPFTFQDGTVISASEVNSNFDKIYQEALSRNAGAMLGLLVTQAILPDADGTRDIGNSANRFNRLWISSQINCSTSCLQETSLIDGSILARINSAEKITGTWQFATNPAFNANAIPETAIANGTLLARLAAADTITGLWTFANVPILNFDQARLRFFDAGGTIDLRAWDVVADNARFELRAFPDNFSGPTTALSVSRIGAVTATAFDGSGAGLTNLNASSITNGTLPYANMPSGSGTWGGSPTISGTVTTNGTIRMNGVIDMPNLPTGSGGDLVYDAAANQVEVVLSSARFKQDIRRATLDPQAVFRLTPKTFAYRRDPTTRRLGLIAEDVAAVLPRAVNYDADGRPDSINQQALLAYLVAAIQELQRR